jgi:cytoskeletal protein CcmA (bactofilin family)
MEEQTRSIGSTLRTTARKVIAGAVAVITAAIVACGGSGMGAGNSATGASTGTSSSASMVSVGTITGFGSVLMNGLEFQTTSAAISVDGQSGSQGDLRAGDIVEVKGHQDASGNQDIADDIDFRGDIQGPVSAIDTVAHTLTILGQTVVVTANTSFDDDIAPTSLAGVSVGDILEVSGMSAADGSVQATRIERRPAGTGLQIIGFAAATNAMAKTLMINALVVNFSAATLVDFPSTGPKDGDRVEVNGTTLDASGALVATRLELRTGFDFKADAGAPAEIEGLITRFASATDFDVAGRPVTTSTATSFEGGSATDLALNLRVEVEGTVNSAGVLMAAKVQIGHPADTRLIGQVDSVDASAGTLLVLGTTIAVESMTRFDDHGQQKIDSFGLASVHIGDWVEVRGSESTTMSGSIVGMRIDRLQPQSGVQLAGAVVNSAQPNFTILSTTIATTASTQFNQGLNATSFFTAPVGRTVTVKGSWNGAILTAASVQLGDNSDDDE